MSNIIGIDLGTTNSGVAIVNNGRPQMLPYGEKNIIPSVVGRAPNGKWLVGTPAWNQYILDPDNTAVSIKRHMGEDYHVDLGDKRLTPAQVSALILRQLKIIAERHLGETVSEAVITVPAYFSDSQRQATRDAGRIAGLKVQRIINEPTAAALAYGLNLEEDKLILVYDLGGGTFDVSLVELMGGIVEVLASHGDTHLGGDDFDYQLARYLADRFDEENDTDIWGDSRAQARLLRAAEQVKIKLSNRPFAWVKEEYLFEKDGIPLHFEHEVSRSLFETEIKPLLEKTAASIEQVLQDADISAEEIDRVLLVGGSSRIPLVRQLIIDLLDIEPEIGINPDEAVALGAAVQAAIIQGEPIDAILVDVTPHSLGIATAELRLGTVIPDQYKVLIPRNSTIPISAEELFHTLYPGQTKIEIQVYQGEKEIASQNRLLGEFLVENLEATTDEGRAQITVRFDFDMDGILQVTARDRATGQEADMTIEASLKRLDETDIENAQNDISALRPLPDTTKALIARANALLANETDGMDKVMYEKLETLLSDIALAQVNHDVLRIDELSETLLDFLFDLE